LAFSGDGRYLLSQSLVNFGNAAAGSRTNVYIFTSQGQPVTPVNPDNPVQWAAWSPGGSSLLGIVRDDPASQSKNLKKAGIYYLDKPDGKSVQLLAGEFAPPVHGANWRGLTWASNNTLLALRTSDQKYVLIQPGSK
jgi:hypothetical protein